MPQPQIMTGRCLCGSVKISSDTFSPEVTLCHCNMCRRWSAGPFMEVNCKSVVFEGEENISRYRSSDWAERGFCKGCGSVIFYHIVDSDSYQISAGLLDDQSTLKMTTQVFTDSKPSFYEFSNKTKMMTEAEVVAMYAPPTE